MATLIETLPLRTIDGATTTLSEYAGKVRLIVNVASKCGLTPQYQALEALYRKYQDSGFEVLGFPANEFNGQEPGTEEEIKAFCSASYDVSFPLFSKIVVKGPGQHPLYAQLTEAKPEAEKLPDTDFRKQLEEYGIATGKPEEILWNFEKFLVDRKGNVMARFSPDVTPDSDLLISAVERALEQSSS